MFKRKVDPKPEDFNGSSNYKEVLEYKTFYGIKAFRKIDNLGYQKISSSKILTEELAKKACEIITKQLMNYMSYAAEFFPKIYEIDNNIRYCWVVSKRYEDGYRNPIGWFKSSLDAVHFFNAFSQKKRGYLDISMVYKDVRESGDCLHLIKEIEDFENYDFESEQSLLEQYYEKYEQRIQGLQSRERFEKTFFGEHGFLYEHISDYTED